MGVKVITPPTLIDVGAGGAITAADLRKHLRIAADGSQDELVTSYAATAHQMAEHYAGRPIGSQTLEIALDAFPDDAIELGPIVTSLLSVKYVDLAGVEQTVASASYTLDDYSSQDCRVLPAFGFTWPATRDVANAVKVRFVAGDVPVAAKQALLVLTTWLYEHRGDEEAQDMPTGVCSLLNTVKRWVV